MRMGGSWFGIGRLGYSLFRRHQRNKAREERQAEKDARREARDLEREERRAARQGAPATPASQVDEGTPPATDEVPTASPAPEPASLTDGTDPVDPPART